MTDLEILQEMAIDEIAEIMTINYGYIYYDLEQLKTFVKKNWRIFADKSTMSMADYFQDYLLANNVCDVVE
jgi:hypothetical protein